MPKTPAKKKPGAKRPPLKPAKTGHQLRSSKAPSPKRSDNGTRVLQTAPLIWYKPLTWRTHAPVPNYRPLPKARILFLNTVKLLYAHWKLFGGICAIYGLLNLILVRGFSGNSDLTTLKSALDGLSNGIGGKLSTSFASFVYLFSASGNSTATSGVYQSILLIVCSLAIIWTLRQVLAGHSVRVRDGFYQGMYPLIPFLLVFLLLGLQLLPLALGGGLYSLVISNGIAIHIWEKALFALIFASAAWWSLRMITGSVFALYIVTLPDMTPLKAIRSARTLVYGRRLLLWRKFIFLPVALLVVAAVIELPLILFFTAGAQWIFIILSVLALAVIHSYMYNLYRELL